MTVSEEGNRLNRLKWANCREPYQTQLNNAAADWITGATSNANLALELWELWSAMKSDGQPIAALPSMPLADVQSNLQVLVEAMLNAAAYSQTLSTNRSDFLNEALSRATQTSERQR